MTSVPYSSAFSFCFLFPPPILPGSEGAVGCRAGLPQETLLRRGHDRAAEKAQSATGGGELLCTAAPHGFLNSGCCRSLTLAVFSPQAARLGILPAGRGKAVAAQGRGRGRGRGGRGRGMLNHMVVDHRPKALTVGGFVEEEKDELLQHFSVSGTWKLIFVSFTAVKSRLS